MPNFRVNGNTNPDPATNETISLTPVGLTGDSID
jgi:hypothetical protein